MTPRELRIASGKVSGRATRDAPGMQSDRAHPVDPAHPGVNPEELARHIAEMYRGVANEAHRDLHFPTSRRLAEALGYSPALRDRLPAEAVMSFAGVGYHFGLARLLGGERVLDVGSGSGMDVFEAAVHVDSQDSVDGIDITQTSCGKPSVLCAANTSASAARIEELPFDTGLFDVVISNGVANLSSSKRRVFAEVVPCASPERAQRTSEQYGAHSISLPALKTHT